MPQLTPLLAASCLCTLFPLSAAAQNGTAGMVLDLQGPPVQVTQGGGTGKLQLLANLTPPARIEVPAGARVSLTVYATRSVYRLSGPSVADISKDGISVVRGQPPEVKPLGEKMIAASQTDALVAGAYRMRGTVVKPAVVLTSPQPGTVLLDTRPRFSWQAAERATYALTLQADTGGFSYQTTVSDSGWALPAGIHLEHGKSYTWKITYISPGAGQTQGASGGFSIASKAESEQLNELRPADSDAIEDWVFYAALLQQRQLREEARSVWRLILSRRPDLQGAAELAK
jgi:hypothetical protein